MLDLSQCQKYSSFHGYCVKCAVIYTQSTVEVKRLQYSKNLTGCFLSSLQRWWNSPNWYRLLNMPCLLRLSTTLKSNFKAFFPSRNRLRLPATPFSLSLPRPTHKRQSPAHAWNRVYTSLCHALSRAPSRIGLNVILFTNYHFEKRPAALQHLSCLCLSLNIRPLAYQHFQSSRQ